MFYNASYAILVADPRPYGMLAFSQKTTTQYNMTNRHHYNKTTNKHHYNKINPKAKHDT